MTVKEFALAAYDPKEIEVFVTQEGYNLVGSNTGKIDPVLLDAIGDYIVEDFKANEPDKYVVWVKTVPVKKVVA